MAARSQLEEKPNKGAVVKSHLMFLSSMCLIYIPYTKVTGTLAVKYVLLTVIKAREL